MMAWILILCMAGYTNASCSGGGLAVQFATKAHCEAAAEAIKKAKDTGGRYSWHVCVESGARP